MLDAEQPTTEAQTEEPDIDSLVEEDDEVDIDGLLDAEQPTTEAQTEEPDIDSLVDEDELSLLSLNALHRRTTLDRQYVVVLKASLSMRSG